jgi:hypothetical protein
VETGNFARYSPRRAAAWPDLRLEQHHRVPARAQFERLFRGSDRGGVVSGDRGGLRHGEVRLGELRIAISKLANDAQVRRLVGVAGEQAVELQESVLRRNAGRGKQALEEGFGFIHAARRHQHGRGHLQGLRRIGFEVEPGARRLQRKIRLVAAARHLDGAPRDARVARLFRELQVRLRREDVVAALLRDLAEQQLVERGFVELLELALILARGLRNRQSGRRTEGNRKQDG